MEARVIISKDIPDVLKLGLTVQNQRTKRKINVH